MKNYLKFIIDNWKIYILAISITLIAVIPIEGLLIFIIYGVTMNIGVAKASSVIVICILIYILLFKGNRKYINYTAYKNNNDMHLCKILIYEILTIFPFFIITFLFTFLIH